MVAVDDPVVLDPEITPSYSYTHYAIAFLNSNMATAKRDLQGLEFDTIIGTGLSGGLVVPRLAKILRVHWAIARKPSEQSHRERTVEGTRMGKRWLFVDDFVSTGCTLERVRNTVSEYCHQRGIQTQCVGSYEYKRNRVRLFEEFSEEF